MTENEGAFPPNSPAARRLANRYDYRLLRNHRERCLLRTSTRRVLPFE